MKKSTINLIHEMINASKAKGIGHLITEDEAYTGSTVTLNGAKVLHFGSCSYLGLELDARLKQKAVEAIQRYGIQFSSSRSYIACTLYRELEVLVEQMFEAPIALSTSTSLGHHGVIPVLVEENDLIILDQQVHSSVQDAAYKMQTRRVTVTVVRHNNMAELEKKLQQFSTSYNRIWYMFDGVYSMYGDFAPMKDIEEMMVKYPRLHLYADDAHGMSWTGKNGRGYVLEQIPHHPRMVVATSFAKAFGVGGGVFVFPDRELCQKVKNCGGAFMFSGPHQVPVLGAAIASAKIHLTPEIYERQQQLVERIQYCHRLMEAYHLPVISNPDTPIFFVGLGLLRVGQKMVRKMLDAGFYVNLSMFPAVPESCTGIRFTITLHHTQEDIRNMVASMAKIFAETMLEEERSMEDIFRAFRHVKVFDKVVSSSHVAAIRESESTFEITKTHTIRAIDPTEWNTRMQRCGAFDWEYLKTLEEGFSGNSEVWNNWDFYYVLVKDQNNRIVIATFLTSFIMKDDMLDVVSTSVQIEKQRRYDPLFLTSKALVMGTMLTTGQHLYIDRQHPAWSKALMLLLDTIWKIQEETNAQTLILRDFEEEDEALVEFFKQQSFIKIPVPNNFMLANDNVNEDEYLASLPREKRYFVRKRALRYQHLYRTTVLPNPSEEQVSQLYRLYRQVVQKSLELNTFPVPEKAFLAMARSANWEFICHEVRVESGEYCLAGMSVNYRTEKEYHFVFTGIEYDYLEAYNVYPQVLWGVVQRAMQLGLKQLSLGVTTAQTKRKYGAVEKHRVGFVQMKDSFNQHLIQSMVGNTAVAEKTGR
jgi:7-keto-8-aminopelargonate synthetase-like enzyme